MSESESEIIAFHFKEFLENRVQFSGVNAVPKRDEKIIELVGESINLIYDLQVIYNTLVQEFLNRKFSNTDGLDSKFYNNNYSSIVNKVLYEMESASQRAARAFRDYSLHMPSSSVENKRLELNSLLERKYNLEKEFLIKKEKIENYYLYFDSLQESQLITPVMLSDPKLQSKNESVYQTISIRGGIVATLSCILLILTYLIFLIVKYKSQVFISVTKV
ncbi:hypothetical protein [Pseudobacteriovorax antillogorgiicola]|nr:hypothetical protein [Pseudobacteriovorax antillogorgiicola]